MVRLAVAAQLLSGLAIAIAGARLLGPWAAEPLLRSSNLLMVGLAILSAASFVFAAWAYERRRRWGVYAHLLALLLQAPVLFGAYAFSIPLVLVMGSLVVSMAVLALMAVALKINSATSIASAALCLTCASFFYQQMGPEVGQYGNECRPVRECFGPVLGSGLPFHYFLDSPGISIPGNIGSEDVFRIQFFVLDAIVYSALVGFVCSPARYGRKRKELRQERRA